MAGLAIAHSVVGDNPIQRFLRRRAMEMKTKSTKLLLLALTAAVMVLGSAAARATVIGSMTGCLLTQVTDGTTPVAMQTSCAGSANLFSSTYGSGGTANVDDAVTEFSFAQGQWTITADFASDESTELTIQSSKAGKVVPGTHLLFALDFAGNSHLDSFADVTVTSSTGRSIAIGSLLDLPVNMGVLGGGQDWYDISFNDAFSFGAGEKITVSANLKTLPEPGSLALLGAVLVALGLVSIKRVRRFGIGFTRLAS